jgi:hypothetical protein
VSGPILCAGRGSSTVFPQRPGVILGDVMEFYNQRFDIGFTDQQKADLVALLISL